jgi:hypothetical protein
MSQVAIRQGLAKKTAIIRVELLESVGIDGIYWLSINEENQSIIINSQDPEFVRCRNCGGTKSLKDNYPLGPSGKYSTVCVDCVLLRNAKIKAVHRQAHPMKQRAREILTLALQYGKIKSGPCIIPGCTETKTEGHHPIYQKPQLIVWLCHTHHKQVDNNKLELPNDYRIITVPLPKKIKSKPKQLDCKVLYCPNPVLAAGYCKTHYSIEKRRLAKEFRAQNQT